jgi:hypothetical protein
VSKFDDLIKAFMELSRVEEFDDSQARSDDGKWTDGGGSSGGSKKDNNQEKRTKPLSNEEHAARMAALKTELDALNERADTLKKAHKSGLGKNIGGGKDFQDNPKKSELKPEHADNSWVKHAEKDHVTDIGQLSADDKKALDAAVKAGVLKKGKGGVFGKTQYASPDFDFENETKKELNDVKKSASFDAWNRQSGGFN